jgi:4-alpha-glucanotransferase
MSNRIRFILAFHNHQPIGNFDQVLHQAFADSYQPFLDLFEHYESMKIALHISGSLMEWLDVCQPRYLDRIADLVGRGQIEILGGPYYEPILAMIPSRDRIGQIRTYTRWLQNRLGATVRGMWIPERVWEQSFARDLADAGMEYTILDDYHFKNAGLTDDQLFGHLLTEDEGRTMSVFPGSERLRYLIPFADPQETIDYLAQIAERHPGATVVFGDDGEKFGSWPDTKKHVYENGWLRRFFDLLESNRHWIEMSTLADAVDRAPPVGKVYLPDSSYREMTEWALPTEQLEQYEHLSHEMKDHPQWSSLRQFMRGGFWRNFKVKYPEANEMYSRMMMVSRRLDEAVQSGHSGKALDQARIELYRGQCNCGYWHGAFGGIYLPHLRNAVYRNLIAADNSLDKAAGKPQSWVEAAAEDYDFDGRQEIRLTNDRLMALIAPSRGGQLVELDVRKIQHNLLATLTRQSEAYHRKVLSGGNHGHDQVASIHDRVVFKQPDLDQRLQYDDHARKSLLDLFYDADASLETVVSGEAAQRGDFVDGAYEARIRRNPDRIQVQLSREGRAGDDAVKITKGLTLDAGSATLEIAYLLENLPQRPLHFAVEFNFAGLPSGCNDRYFSDADGNHLGQLGVRLDLADVQGLSLTDEWLGIEAGLKLSRPTGFWTFPIETVSQSEGGFELVHQSVAVLPHWLVAAEADGRWGVTIRLSLDTSRAESRQPQSVAVATN